MYTPSLFIYKTISAIEDRYMDRCIWGFHGVSINGGSQNDCFEMEKPIQIDYL
jgi:hypothetical protein